ncbi:peptidase family C50-domain-containing protein [Xylariaceae sp. FL1651]|nr:peptidase family C50-domain-containing protein [Xylariaceae sp. FL1651]
MSAHDYMASFTAQADAIRSALASVSTCTPTISASLKDLLQCKQDNNNDVSKPTVKTTSRKTTQVTSKIKPSTATKKPAKKALASTIEQDAYHSGDELSPREKATLATQVINATLKALGDAAKTTSVLHPRPRSPAKNDVAKPATRTRLRRSASMPMTPLQPRSLNRVSTSPATTKASLLLPKPASIGCLALVECARVAFATLRSLQSSGAITLPDLQVELGMSSLINKLIALKLFDQAVKELRILKRRLECMATENITKKGSASTANSNATPKTLSDLLDYPAGTYSAPVLHFITTAQLQALRILHGLKKSTHLDAILPFLRQANSSSPLNLLLSSLRGEKPDCVKVARQLESLSQSLLSLTPSLAPKDDDVAQEPRLSPSPDAALEVQILGLIARLESWNITGHKGDINKEILLPLSKCLATFLRRTSPEHSSKLTVFFGQVWERIETLGFQVSGSSKPSLAAIYQLLATAAQGSGDSKEAKKWTVKWRSLTNPNEDSAARCCAVTAQLLALSLKDSSGIDENLIVQVLDGMQGTLSGSVMELDDLLASLCLLRKAVVNIVIKKPTCTAETSQTTRQLLETFIIQLPRFALRWLGKPPASSSATKDFLRFEQRRQLLSKYQHQILDSALMLTKSQLDEDTLVWEVMDSMLQDALTLLEYMGNLVQTSTRSNPSASYHVKISHLYYQQHLIFRKSTSKDAEATSLRALRRSIDSVREQSQPEQARAQLFKKWESFVELCKASGRRDAATDALRSIRDHLVRQDIVETITNSLKTRSVTQSWKTSAETELLSRTVCNLAKLDRKPNDWTWLLTGEDKATALEHDLYFIIMNDTKGQQVIDVSGQTVNDLLQLYSTEKHPIRRLRTLQLLLLANVDMRGQVEKFRTEIEIALANIGDGSLGDDNGLARYLPYLHHLTVCIFALAYGELDSTEIQRAITKWRLMVAGFESASQLAEHVDDPQLLLKTLQSLADLVRMKGLQSLLTNIIELSTMVSHLTIDNNIDLHILQSANLCSHYVTLGRSIMAEKTLQTILTRATLPQISRDVISSFHLSAAEYYLAIGSFDKAEQHLVEAREAVIASSDKNLRKNSQINRKISIAYASFLTSSLALERGENHRALRLAKAAVKILFQDWSQLEECRNSSSDVIMEDLSQADSSGEDSSLNGSRMADFNIVRANTGPEFWALVYPLYRFICRLSTTYAHLGMYQETLYYAEQAQKVAKSMGSSAYFAQATTWIASVSLMAGDPAKSVELVTEAKPVLLASEPSCQVVTAICRAASVYRETKEQDDEAQLLMNAESMLQELRKKNIPEGNLAGANLETGLAKLAIKETVPSKARTRAPNASKPPRVLKTKKPGIRETEKTTTALEEEDAQLKSLQASVLQTRSITLLKNKDWAAAITTLRSAVQLSKLSSDLAQELFFLSMSLIGQSLEQMSSDSVFSFIQDSTLSFPSVATAARDKTYQGQSPIKRTSPARKPRSTTRDIQGFVDNLHDAQEHLLEAQSVASRNGNGVLVHRIAAALQNVAVLLSNTSSLSSGASHPAHATCSMELARNLTWRRERKANRCDTAKEMKGSWPMVVDSADPRRSSLGFSIDMDRFQREYVDIIPKTWNVISVSLSENKHDLCITKLQAGFSPFALRLPLERANSRDADTEVFDFQQGRSELLELIQMANRTCHDARDMSQKGAKSAWWAEREELDERLKQLLDNIEETWLGGFKGIFTQHHKRSDLLARFQKSFQIILEKHLPSRRQFRGRKVKTTATKVTLDPRILELFIGLGDATAPQCDLDEPLTDLLYFVVDVLQFHGEINAYDEIDFDAMVVDTFDALHAYHSAAKNSKNDEDGVHTILILDKPLHVFPWESLPCLHGLAVSRVPSLDCLRRSILESRDPGSDNEPSDVASGSRAGHHVSTNSGTYILNPSADLTNTEATFGRALSSLPPAWCSIQTRAPTESEFQTALTDKDILLYFGHGSGGQYIRGRTIRQLEKCRAVALLMGCSSASLTHAGDFEPYGPVWNYMLAGSPAVVGTLWDVTDRDIDRFAGAVFEEWGLMPRGTFAEDATTRKGVGKGKGKVASARGTAGRKKGGVGSAEEKSTSLVEAVAKARTDACRFKYLTAAAVCVYGIPVYVSK